jgi:hypothetical protein
LCSHFGLLGVHRENARLQFADRLKGEHFMQRVLARAVSMVHRRGFVYIYLGILFLLKIAIQVVLYQRGFISVSADEFARGIRAAQWALQPRLDIFETEEVWLPFEKYLNGLLLLIWPDVMMAPRVTAFIASYLLLIALFWLVYYLFGKFSVAALASLFVVFQPWYAWLSGTPMLEMYYLACFLVGLVFLVIWLNEERRGYWFWAGCCFMLASGFHAQSWTMINIVNLLTVVDLYQYIRQKQYRRIWRLLIFYCLGNAFIIAFTIVEFARAGRLFNFLAEHTSYSKWFYGGYNVSVLEKFLYYPKLVIQNSSGVVWVLMAAALAFLWRDRDHRWRFFPLTVAALVLCLNSVINVFSVPATAAPGRYSLFYILMLSPYLAYGAYRLALWGQQYSSRVVTYVLIMLSAGLFLYGVWWGISRLLNFPHGMSLDAVKTGYYLNKMVSQNTSVPSTYMVELKYWDFLAVKLTAGHYDAIVFDREYNIYNRNTPSIFEGDIADIYAYMILHKVQYIALCDPKLKARAQVIDFLLPKQNIGNWTIYEFKPKP